MSPSDQPDHSIAEAVQRTLEELGVRDAATLQKLFEKLDDLLGGDLAAIAAGDSPAIEAARVRWLGRKQGFVRSITDNWLPSAPGELKRQVGQFANSLRQRAEEGIEAAARRPATSSAQPLRRPAEVLPSPPPLGQS